MTALLLALALFTAGDDSLAAARDLYASAAYEEALVVRGRLPDANRPVEETRAIEQYRALCLLALGRTADAERSIEAVIAADPSFRPATDVSPRIRNAFTDVRRRMLPTMIQQKYNAGKAAFDQKQWESAADLFTQVLVVMTDPDVADAASRPPLADLRTLAAGFRDLATTAAAPPPPPPPPVAAPPPAPELPKAIPAKIYTLSDADVVPPIALKQDLPPFPGPVLAPRVGLVEVLINEAGVVETAVIRQPVTPQYDVIALNAAKSWRYRPATVSGTPVKFRKAVQITIKPDRR